LALTLAPRAFGIDGLRAGFPDGSELKFRIAKNGEATRIEHWVFHPVDAEGATIASRVLDESGAVVKAEETGIAPWSELLAHASFPAADTTLESSSVTVPFGAFETWLYTVRRKGEDGGEELSRYHFGKTVPGPPLLFTTERAGAEVFRMEQIERKPLPQVLAGG
jgi:hypothetical protein